MKRFLLFFTFLVSSGWVQAHPLTTEQKLEDFQQLLTNIKANYGPLDYKKDEIGIDWMLLANEYEAKILETQNNSDYYYTLLRFVAEFQDGHFSMRLPSDYAKSLPIYTDLVGDKVLVDMVNRSELGVADFPFEKGDEVVSVDGVPTQELLEQRKAYYGNGFERSSRRTAALTLLLNRASRHPVPESDHVTLEIRKNGREAVDRVTLKWNVRGEKLDLESLDLSRSGENLFATHRNTARSGSPFKGIPYPDLGQREMWQELLGQKRMEYSYMCSGSSRIERPENATVIMEEPFVAYRWPTEKGELGYLRIPHYSPRNTATGEAEYDLRLAQYTYAVSQLEKNTMGLIIDQDHNCGGSVMYLEQMLGLFLPENYDPMVFQFLSNKTELVKFQGWLSSVPTNTLEHEQFSKTVDLLKKSWLEGLRMTPKTSFNNMVPLAPSNEARYTKPIVVLIDELSGSGGDAFPSMMQGYGRATLLGTRTMGAGGHVEAQPVLSHSGMGYRMTRSLFYRPDGVAVENNGAVPDISYEITEEDFTDSYRIYRDFYTEQLLEKIEQN